MNALTGLGRRLGALRRTDAVSPTAHYTGEVWVRHGLSHDELATAEGRVLHDALAPLMIASRALGGPTLRGSLLARHRIIDALLEEAIGDGTVGQVVEVACGMSPRGWRFVTRHGPALTYVEADLPAMAARKRRALARMGGGPRVAEVDVLRGEGPGSLAEIAAGLDPERGVAVIAEGLLTYFPEQGVRTIWRNIAAATAGFPAALHLADIRLGRGGGGLPERVFGAALGAFVQGRVHRHFSGPGEAAAALRAAGFGGATLHRGDEHPAAGDAGEDPGAALIHVVEAHRP